MHDRTEGGGEGEKAAGRAGCDDVSGGLNLRGTGGALRQARRTLICDDRRGVAHADLNIGILSISIPETKLWRFKSPETRWGFHIR